MVDAVVTVFLEKLLQVIQAESSVVTEYSEQLVRLRSELQLLQSFLKDADRQKRKNHTLRTMMVHLQELVYEAEDILADCQLQSKEDEDVASNCLMCFPPSDLPFRYLKGKRLKKINEEITNIHNKIQTFIRPLDQSVDHEKPRWSSLVYDHTQVVGLEGDTQKLKQWLFEGNNGLLAIGIVGMGGVGKTTTAQTVYNDREIEAHFEKRMWVSVSQTLDEEQIMRSMLRNLGDVSVGDDRGELLKKINQYLLGKRYLIVMDDVWSKDNTWWLQISVGLPKGNKSSVIITTRIEEVAQKMGVTERRTHRPKFLSSDDSWLLFRKIAFAESDGVCGYSELEGVGKEIVEKCGGLPLAIKAVGGIMLCKSPYYHVWKRIADNFREELAANDSTVMASLQLSYDELPPYLKSCFLCFSLYPEDCVITKNQLVRWWIGEGFVPVMSDRLEVEAGEDCFSGLMNRCLIEVVDKTYDGNISTCKIHDMVRDLLIDMVKHDVNSGASCRRLGLRNDIHRGHFQNTLKLRALLSTTKTGEVNKITSSVAEKICDYRYLRVLDLSKSIFKTHLTSLLEEVGSLQHLTYLSISNTHPLIQVPHSMEKLSNLQILDASYCQNLKMLPSYITTLGKLSILDLSNCGSLKYLPKGLGRLSNLQALLGFRPARSSQSEGCRIGELKNLTQLKTLQLRLTRGDEVGDDEVDVLYHLQQLQFLTISCFDSQGSDVVSKLDRLSPPRQLHELCLKFFPGEMSPTWLNPISLPMLRYLSISSGKLAKMNQGFWGMESAVWKVQGLMLESLSHLEEEWPTIQQAMPSLRIMSVCWCPKLESFPIEAVGFKGGVWKK